MTDGAGFDTPLRGYPARTEFIGSRRTPLGPCFRRDDGSIEIVSQGIDAAGE
jgi:hypothetical protein